MSFVGAQLVSCPAEQEKKNIVNLQAAAAPSNGFEGSSSTKKERWMSTRS